MKKFQYIIAGLSVLVLFGCEKEQAIVEPEANTITLNGYYNDGLLAKSAYTLVGDTYKFEWVSSDKFVAQSFNGVAYGQTLFTTSTGGSASSDFTGTVSDGYSLQNYAFYPNAGDGKTSYTNNFVYKNVAITPVAVDADVSAETATVTLAGTITEDKDHPMAHIPMIGVKDGNGDYQFTPCTGVLKVTIKNFPTSATQVRLDIISGSYALNGNYVFDANYEIKDAYCIGSKWGLKYMNITAGTDSNGDGITDAPRSFYFPIPTGSITASKLELSVKDGDDVWSQGLMGMTVVLQKGVVTELPPVTYQSGSSVSIVGTMMQPKARIRMGGSGSQFIIFKITDNTTVPDELNNTGFSGKLSFSQTWTIGKNDTYFPGNATSGQKYFHYQIYNSDNSKYGEAKYVPFWYVADSDFKIALSTSATSTASAPELNLSTKHELVEEVRAVLTDLSASDAYAKLDASKITPDADVTVITSISDNNTLNIPAGLTSGKQKIYMRAYNNSHDKVVDDRAIDVYYLSASDKTILSGQFSVTSATFWTGSWGSSSTSSFTFAENSGSTIGNGNIKLTEFDGKNGSAYGVYDGTTAMATFTSAYLKTNIFYTEADVNYYFLNGSTGSDVTFKYDGEDGDDYVCYLYSLSGGIATIVDAAWNWKRVYYGANGNLANKNKFLGKKAK